MAPVPLLRTSPSGHAGESRYSANNQQGACPISDSPAKQAWDRHRWRQSPCCALQLQGTPGSLNTRQIISTGTGACKVPVPSPIRLASHAWDRHRWRQSPCCVLQLQGTPGSLDARQIISRVPVPSPTRLRSKHGTGTDGAGPPAADASEAPSLVSCATTGTQPAYLRQVENR